MGATTAERAGATRPGGRGKSETKPDQPTADVQAAVKELDHQTETQIATLIWTGRRLVGRLYYGDKTGFRATIGYDSTERWTLAVILLSEHGPEIHLVAEVIDLDATEFRTLMDMTRDAARTLRALRAWRPTLGWGKS